MAFGDGVTDSLQDFVLTVPAGVIYNKTSLSIETNPVFVQRKVSRQGTNVYMGEDPPVLRLEFIEGDGFHADDTTMGEGTPVEQFDLIHTDGDALANLQARWPVDGVDADGRAVKWLWGKRSTTRTPTEETKVSVEIVTHCLNERE